MLFDPLRVSRLDWRYSSRMPMLPEGMVTFLFTDVEGSTALWESDADGMSVACARLDELVEACVGAHRGYLHRPRGEGDSHFLIFSEATEASRRRSTSSVGSLRRRGRPKHPFACGWLCTPVGRTSAQGITTASR